MTLRRHLRQPRSLLLLACAVWLGPPAPATACLADGQVAVSTPLSQQICNAAPAHGANVACCSGKASPVWNPQTNMCDFVCDPSNRCENVTCTALSQCHL